MKKIVLFSEIVIIIFSLFLPGKKPCGFDFLIYFQTYIHLDMTHLFTKEVTNSQRTTKNDDYME